MSFNRFIPQYSTASLSVPTASGMVLGELAINIPDGRIYTCDQNNNIVLLGGTAITSSFANNAATSALATTAIALGTDTTLSWTTPSITTQATYTASIAMPQRSIVYIVSSSVYSRIELYNNTTNQTADVARNTASFASASSGLLLDVVCSGSSLITYLSPPAQCYGGTVTPTASMGITITNFTGITQALSGSITYMSF